MSKSNSVKKEKKIYQKWWIWLVAIIVIIAGIYFIFGDEIKAYRMGIDVQYLKNPKYCQLDSDCDKRATCNPSNIYNFEKEYNRCERTTCGVSCRNNQCYVETTCVRVGENGAIESYIDGKWENPTNWVDEK